MPYYEYHCLDCGKTFSLFMTVQKHQESSFLPCPHCAGPNVKQLYTSVSVMTSKKS
jgi:putative FmdB family regulatory protein